ncbi:MAG: AmmeMemoRadiSam system protein A, partial [Firmicutes bacterium]|nr:AmmeMemoRadiSam system protein A [Bacillota bacterium]
LSYEGPFGVGYAVCKYKTKGEDLSRNFLDQYMDEKKAELDAIREKEDAYVKLARRSLESFLLRRCKLQTPEDLAPEFTEKKAGVFVSIKKDGRLRGCMGTIKPVENCVADEIINNALAAGFGDTRFNALKEHELDEIQISVDVLGEPEKVDSVDMLDPQKYGVIVGMGCAEGLLLPNLEGITTVEQQVAIALQKAGIPKTSGFEIKRFEVERHV